MKKSQKINLDVHFFIKAYPLPIFSAPKSCTTKISSRNVALAFHYFTLIILERSPASANSNTMFSSLSSMNDAKYFITLGWFSCWKIKYRQILVMRQNEEKRIFKANSRGFPSTWTGLILKSENRYNVTFYMYIISRKISFLNMGHLFTASYLNEDILSQR